MLGGDGACCGAGRAPASGRPGRTRPGPKPGDGLQRPGGGWEKFCRYWQVEPRFRAHGAGGGCTCAAAEAAAQVRREHHRRGRRFMGSPWMAGLPRARARDQPGPWTGYRPNRATDVADPRGRRVGKGFVAPFPAARTGVGDFRVPGWRPSTPSGHKYGLGNIPGSAGVHVADAGRPLPEDLVLQGQLPRRRRCRRSHSTSRGPPARRWLRSTTTFIRLGRQGLPSGVPARLPGDVALHLSAGNRQDGARFRVADRGP